MAILYLYTYRQAQKNIIIYRQADSYIIIYRHTNSRHRIKNSWFRVRITTHFHYIALVFFWNSSKFLITSCHIWSVKIVDMKGICSIFQLKCVIPCDIFYLACFVECFCMERFLPCWCVDKILDACSLYLYVVQSQLLIWASHAHDSFYHLSRSGALKRNFHIFIQFNLAHHALLFSFLVLRRFGNIQMIEADKI